MFSAAIPTITLNSNQHGENWPSVNTDSLSTGDFSFAGRFSRSDENTVIHIGSSDGSNSPTRYSSLNINRDRSPISIVASRSSSPSRINSLLSRNDDLIISRVATDEESLSNLNVSNTRPTSTYGESISQVWMKLSHFNTINA